MCCHSAGSASPDGASHRRKERLTQLETSEKHRVWKKNVPSLQKIRAVDSGFWCRRTKTAHQSSTGETRTMMTHYIFFGRGRGIHLLQRLHACRCLIKPIGLFAASGFSLEDHPSASRTEPMRVPGPPWERAVERSGPSR